MSARRIIPIFLSLLVILLPLTACGAEPACDGVRWEFSLSRSGDGVLGITFKYLSHKIKGRPVVVFTYPSVLAGLGPSVFTGDKIDPASAQHKEILKLMKAHMRRENKEWLIEAEEYALMVFPEFKGGEYRAEIKVPYAGDNLRLVTIYTVTDLDMCVDIQAAGYN